MATSSNSTQDLKNVSPFSLGAGSETFNKPNSQNKATLLPLGKPGYHKEPIHWPISDFLSQLVVTLTSYKLEINFLTALGRGEGNNRRFHPGIAVEGGCRGKTRARL